MKVLSVNSIVPPERLGGAEKSASDLALGLTELGHSVTLLGTQVSAEEFPSELDWNGVAVVRRKFLRPYSIADASKQTGLRKFAWHLADHAAPANVKTFSRALREISPDCVVLHNLQGIGFNILKALRAIPTIHVLHDLGLVCLNRSMYRGGHRCVSRCLPCLAVTAVHVRQVSRMSRFALVSPSKANLATIANYCDLTGVRTTVIPNANRYPIFEAMPRDGRPIRLLFVGRLASEKGVGFLLSVIQEFGKCYDFSLDILGAGPEREHLARLNGSNDRVRFRGQVDISEVGKAMADSDLLLVPSLWDENFPGVIIHALLSGLPVFASDSGGNREIVQDHANGRLLAPGNSVEWQTALRWAAENPVAIADMREGATRSGAQYSARQLAVRYAELLEDLRMTVPKSVVGAVPTSS